MSHPTQSACVFCRIVAGQLPCFKLHEDGATMAFMDINPVNPGHALSIAKGHWPTIDSIPADVMADVARTAHRIAGAVTRALKPDGVNLVQANGVAAGQTVPHLHIHIMPRRSGDGATLNWEQKPGDMKAIEGVYKRLMAVL